MITTIGQIVRGDSEIFPPYLYEAYRSTVRRALLITVTAALGGLAARDALATSIGARAPRLWPRTGRTHQLRVQASTRGLTILGDVSYGSERPFPVGIALRTRSLSVRHPMLRTELRVSAPVPDHWSGAGILLPDD